MKFLLAAIAAVTGLIASWRWYQSSLVNPDPGWGPPGSGRGHEPSDTAGQALGWSVANMNAFSEVSQLNKEAARWTAASVLAAALSSLF